MMSQTQAFKTITGQSDKIDYAMSRADIDALLQVVFSKAIKDEMLQPAEVDAITGAVMSHMDKGGDGTVGSDEFLDACAGNEEVSVEAIAKLFDKERSRGIGEVIFSNLSSALEEGEA